MNHKEFNFPTSDGQALYGQVWSTNENPAGVICLVHGLAEYSARYIHWAERFVNNNYAFMGFDLRGHGHSPGKRGFIPSYEMVMDDISLFLEKAGSFFPNLPLYLYGHSMGGNLVLNYVIDRKPTIKGVIASSPWLRLKKEKPGIVMGLIRFLNAIAPGLSIPTGLDANGLSRDKEVVQQYIDDPLIYGIISLRLGIAIHDHGLQAIEKAGELKLPLLLMHGTGDLITDPAATREFANGVANDVTYKEWDGLYHETHNEPEKDEVFAFILQWLKIH